jgi:hypothetical protein
MVAAAVPVLHSSEFVRMSDCFLFCGKRLRLWGNRRLHLRSLHVLKPVLWKGGDGRLF